MGLRILPILLLLATPARGPGRHATAAVAYGGCQSGQLPDRLVQRLGGSRYRQRWGAGEIVWGSYDVVALSVDGTVEWRAANAQQVAGHCRGGFRYGLAGTGERRRARWQSADPVQRQRQHPVDTQPFANGEGAPAAADIDDNGDLEIVVGRASSGGDRQVSVYEHDGSLRARAGRRSGEPGFGAGMYNENLAVERSRWRWAERDLCAHRYALHHRAASGTAISCWPAPCTD